MTEILRKDPETLQKERDAYRERARALVAVIKARSAGDQKRRGMLVSRDEVPKVSEVITGINSLYSDSVSPQTGQCLVTQGLLHILRTAEVRNLTPQELRVFNAGVILLANVMDPDRLNGSEILEGARPAGRRMGLAGVNP